MVHLYLFRSIEGIGIGMPVIIIYFILLISIASAPLRINIEGKCELCILDNFSTDGQLINYIIGLYWLAYSLYNLHEIDICASCPLFVASSFDHSHGMHEKCIVVGGR